MLKAIACFFLPFLRKQPCTCGDPLAAATVTVSTEPPRPRPTRPPVCPVCDGRSVLLVQVGCLLGMPVHTQQPCRCCGGVGVIPRVVAERIRQDPATVRDYRAAFMSN